MVPAASHLITSPDRNHAPKGIASTTPYSQGLRFLYRHSRRRLGSPWVGPINAALKRLKLATVTPGATSTLSASSSSLFLCRCSDAFSSSFTHALSRYSPWVKEEQKASEHRQRKREEEEADKVDVAPGVTVVSLRSSRAALIGPTQRLPKRRRLCLKL